MVEKFAVKKQFFPSSSVKHGLAKHLIFYFTTRDCPLSKPHGPWPAAVGGPWNPESLNLPYDNVFQSFILIIISIQRNLGVDVMAQLMSSMIFHWITSLNYSSHANTIETFTLIRNWLLQVHLLNLRKTFQITEFWNMKRLLKMSKLVVTISQKYWSNQNTIWPTFMPCKYCFI